GYSLDAVGDKSTQIANVLTNTLQKDNAAKQATQAAQQGLVAAQTAADTFTKASQAALDQTKLVNSDMVILQQAKNDQSKEDIVAQMTTKLAADQKTLAVTQAVAVAAGVDFANKVSANALTGDPDVARAATALVDKTGTTVQNDVNAAKT